MKIPLPPGAIGAMVSRNGAAPRFHPAVPDQDAELGALLTDNTDVELALMVLRLQAQLLAFYTPEAVHIRTLGRLEMQRRGQRSRGPGE